jgi:hypothetical protein
MTRIMARYQFKFQAAGECRSRSHSESLTPTESLMERAVTVTAAARPGGRL